MGIQPTATPELVGYKQPEFLFGTYERVEKSNIFLFFNTFFFFSSLKSGRSAAKDVRGELSQVLISLYQEVNSFWSLQGSGQAPSLSLFHSLLYRIYPSLCLSQFIFLSLSFFELSKLLFLTLLFRSLKFSLASFPHNIFISIFLILSF